MTYIALDVDGTLFDCGDIIVEAFQEGIAKFKSDRKKEMEVPAKEKILSVVGQPTDLIFKSLFPGLAEEELVLLNDLCTQSLVEMIRKGGGIIFDNVYETMEKLHNEGRILLVASNGRTAYIEAILEANDIRKFIHDPIVTLDSDVRTKAGIVKRYINDVSGDNLLVMIGDRASDKEAAYKNKIPFIGCDFGHANAEELKGVKRIVLDFGDVYDVIKEIESEFDISN